MLHGQQRTLPHWIDDIHAQQTISVGISKYRRSHTIIFFIILMNEKSVSISVYLENKTTIIRLSPCVQITFWTVTFRFFMNVNFIRHRRMLSHLCRIRVLWFPLKEIWNDIASLMLFLAKLFFLMKINSLHSFINSFSILRVRTVAKRHIRSFMFTASFILVSCVKLQ